MSVELQVWHKSRYDITTPTGILSLQQQRIITLVQIHHDLPLVEGLIDTGAPLSVFPQQVWSWFGDEIDWLTEESDDHVPDWLRFVGGLTGGSIPCRVGRVRVTLHDKHLQPILPATTLIAKMVLDGRRLPHRVLIGLSGQPLESGFHWLGGATPRAWLDPVSTSG